MKFKKLFNAIVIAGTVASVSACSQMQTAMNGLGKDAEQQKEEMVQQIKAEVSKLYEVHHEDGRLYFFYDKKSYTHFLQHGETPYTYKRIASGPHGETLVFGLMGKDKKKTSGIPSVEMFDGKQQPELSYGEARVEGRIYVFSTLKDMEDMRTVGEAPYRYTDIGSGPNGETVVYVLNKGNKKKRPDALIAAFKKAYNKM